MTNNIKKPPVLGNWLLKAFSRSEYQVALLEAIEDEYYEICENDCIFKARKWFRYQVIRSLPILVLGGFYLRLISMKDYVGFHSRRVSKTKYLFRFRVLLPVNITVLAFLLTTSTFTSFVLCNKAPTAPQYAKTNKINNFIGNNQELLFFSRENSGHSIYTVDLKGKNLRKLSSDYVDSRFPSWSPDGSKILFEESKDSDDSDNEVSNIYIMDKDGSNKRQLTFNFAVNSSPELSPDGTKIIYTSFRDNNWDLFLVNADGTNEQQLTYSYAHDINPSWSPDGSQILFVTERDYPNGIETEVADNWEIYLMNSDGSDKQRLTNNNATDNIPSFSPDGSKVLYFSNESGYFEIFTMNPDGSNKTKLTEGNGKPSYCPSWSPDGAKIAYLSGNQSEDSDIFIMNADGSNKEKVFDSAWVRLVRWSPKVR